jgi:hypothetical protein
MAILFEMLELADSFKEAMDEAAKW